MTSLAPQPRSTARPESPTRFRGDIEGLRAVAVLVVLVDHARLPLTGGYVGVDVFFVISGFLITTLLVREMTLSGSVSMAGFYARRARRLLPGAAVVLVATAVLTLEFLPRTRWSDTGLDVMSSALYGQNWRLAEQAVDYQAQTDAASPLQHFWSLAVEEQFYFLWPTLLLAVTVFVRPRPREGRGVWLPGRSRRGDRRSTAPLLLGMAVVAVPSFAWSVLRTASDPQASYFTTTTRLWELAVGGGVAILAPRLATLPPVVAAAMGWTGLAVILGCAVTYTAATPFPGSAALAPVLGAAAVIAAGRAAGKRRARGRARGRPDALGRAVVVLVVPVALAAARGRHGCGGCPRAVAGSPRGPRVRRARLPGVPVRRGAVPPRRGASDGRGRPPARCSPAVSSPLPPWPRGSSSSSPPGRHRHPRWIPPSPQPSPRRRQRRVPR